MARPKKTISPEHKAKLAAGRAAKKSETAQLREQLAAAQTQINALLAASSVKVVTEKNPEMKSSPDAKFNGGYATRDPITGYAESLKLDMQAYVQDQLRTMMPERGDPIKSREHRETRQAVRKNAVIAYDREGNPVYRRRDSISDPFSIPPDLQERDWDRQWVRVSVHGWEDVDNQVGMQENGWRPVSADRPGWEGRFMPPGYKGAIQKSGLMLMERPMTLTQEANYEAGKIIRSQTQTQRQQFGMALPSGFDANTPAARAATGVKVHKPEPTPSYLRPQHEVAAMEIE